MSIPQNEILKVTNNPDLQNTIQNLQKVLSKVHNNIIIFFNNPEVQRLIASIGKITIAFHQYLKDPVVLEKIETYKKILEQTINSKEFQENFKKKNTTLKNINKKNEIFEELISNEITININNSFNFNTITYDNYTNTTPSYLKLSIIFTILFNFISPQIEMIIFEYATKPAITYLTTKNEVKNISKNEIKKNDLTELYGLRITLTNVNLRIKPNKKAEIIEVLDKAKIIKVISEPGLHKSWLKIEVDFNGEKVQGYILRLHTHVIKP